MNTSGARRSDGRTWLIVVTAVAMALSAIGLVTPNIAQAVTLGTLTTRMEIDGNKANAAGFDWNDIQDGTLPGGYVVTPGVVSAGVVAQTYQIDGPSITQSCGVQDADSVVDGSKLDDNPWPVQAGLPNSKNDICSGGAAAEAVNVNGAVHYLLYQYYTRSPSATGDQSVVTSLNGPLPGRCDDLLIDYNFGPSSGLVTTLYRWTPTVADACANTLGSGSWGGATVLSAGFVQTASGANPELNPATANPSTFGEFAIDLTAAGVMPENRCVTFTTGSTLTYTGNSTQASLKDILNFSNPIVLNNCGTISVAKVTEPAGFGAGQNFAYKLSQTDAQPVHDSTLAVSGGGSDTDASNLSISSLIQTAQTHLWSNVLAQPDYQLQEVTVPANWQVKQITCTFWDPFFVSGGLVTPQLRTATTTTASLAGIGIPSPQLKPAGQPNTNCTITNATSGIRLVKAGSGDANQTFNFSMTGQTVPALKLGSSADFAFAPGTSVSINETLPSTTPAWQLTKVECKLADGTLVGTVTGTQVALQTVAGQVVTCTYTNDQKARIIVNKTGTGSAAQTFPFEQSWDGNTTAPEDFSLALGATTNSGDIAPGRYTVSELLPATSPAWLLNSISCTDDAGGANQSTTSVANPTATITLKAGDTVSCTFTNNQQGRLVLVKNTVGPDGTFSFSGPISSVATSANTGTVGLDVSPGTYPVGETVPAGWALTSSSCDQGRSLPNVVINAGQTVTCAFNNTKLGKIIVTKQTLPDGSPQQFTFDGSWSGAGTDLTLTDGQSGDSGFINPGTYSVAETAIPAGWDLTSASCSDGSPITAIAVSADETVTCTFANTQRGNIVIVKNSGVAAGTFTFNQTWSSGTGATTPFAITTVAPGNIGQQQFSNITPGSYTVSETDPGTAFDLKSLQCVDGANSTKASSPSSPQLLTSGTVNVDPGETVVCTFSNSKKGTIVIVKAAQPNLAAAFGFTASAPLSNFSINGSGSQAFSNITATEVNGTTYPVVEGTTPGWALDSISCSNTASTTDLIARQATISVGPGETVTCTFTNIAAPAALSLTKSVSGVDSTYPWSFDFTLTPPGTPSGTKTFAGTGNTTSVAQTWTGLVPGQSYTLGEQAAPGWSSSISCTLTAADGSISSSTTLPFTFIAQPGEAIGCAAGNAAQPATLNVTKSVTGLDPAADWGPFTITLTPGATPASDVVSKADPLAQFSGLVPGTSYSLNETLAPGWIAGSFSCSVIHAGSNTSTPIGAPPLSVQPGDQIACGITNAAQPATLQVIKTAVGAGGDFTFPVSGLASPISISLATQGVQGSALVDLVPGAEYGVAESDPGATWIQGLMNCTFVAADGSTGSVSPSTFTPTPGEAVTCRITNTKKGNIVIAKTAVGGDGIFTFTGTAGGSINTATSPTDSYTLPNVVPGAYSATETSLAGWDLTSLTCSDIDSTVDLGTATASIAVGPGETVTCTYTNTKRGTITIDKVVVPGADTTQFGFTFNGQPFALTGADTPFTSGLVVPGTYVIDEPAVAGWQLTGLDCVGQRGSSVDIVGSTATIGLAAGENISCTYTNSRRGPVKVLKTLTDGPTIVSGNVYTVGYDLAVTSESTINELYDLSDTIAFGTGTTIVSATLTTVDGPAPNVGGWDGVTHPQIQNQALINPATVDPNGHTYHVVVTFAVAGSMTVSARDCVLSIGESGTGTLNTASVSSALGENTSSDCGAIPNPLVSLGKTISAGPTRDAAGVWTIEYKVTVANAGDGPAQYSLNDTFGFGAGVTVTNVAVSTSPTGLTFSATNAGVTTSGTQLNAGDTHVYTITVTATIAVSPQTNGDCANGGGFGNTASVTTNHTVPNASVCAPFSTITLIKSVVNNDGGMLQPGDVTLTATGPATVSGTTPVASAIPAGLYALSESAVPGYSTVGFDCGATVNVAAGSNVVCTIVNDDIAPSLTLIKTVVNDDGGALKPADFSLQIGGTTAAQNIALVQVAGVALNIGELPVQGYLPTGVTCTSDLGLAVTAAGTDAITVTPGLAEDIICTITNDDVRPGLTVVKNVVTDNGGDAVVSDFVLQVNDTQVISDELNQYPAATPLVIREVQIPGYVAIGTVCVSDQIGSNNALSVSTGGATVTLSPGESVRCTITNDDQAPTITVVKNIVNDDGGDAVVSDFPLFVGDTEVTSGVAATVDANQSYDVSETQQGGYALTSLDCSDAAGTSVPTPVVPNEGDQITCTLVNDDLPVDLQITKSDAGAEPLAGETFTYTLTVSNLGTRDADLGEPVVVTDVLPAGVSWVLPMPANCTVAGHVVTCTVDPADLQVGESVTISLQAEIDDITAPTTFTNKAFVTTVDDPACATQGCVPPCASTVRVEVVTGTNPSNNVACEDTPARVLTDVQIDKTTTTPSPLLGSIVVYTLTVSNLGPNTARDVTVTDPIPAPLVLQSVSSSDFTCTSANNGISCSRPVLLVGEVGTITVTALVPASAVGGVSLLNTATVGTSTPETNLGNNRDTAIVNPIAVASEAPTIPVIPPTAELPRTGIDVGEMLRLAALLAAGGAVALVTARRRKRGDHEGIAC